MNSLDAAFIAWVQQYWNWIRFSYRRSAGNRLHPRLGLAVRPRHLPLRAAVQPESPPDLLFVLGVILIFICVWQWNQVPAQ